MLIIRKGNQREEIIMAIGHSCHIIYIFRHQDRWTMMVTKSSKLTKVQSSMAIDRRFKRKPSIIYNHEHNEWWRDS